MENNKENDNEDFTKSLISLKNNEENLAISFEKESINYDFLLFSKEVIKENEQEIIKDINKKNLINSLEKNEKSTVSIEKMPLTDESNSLTTVKSQKSEEKINNNDDDPIKNYREIDDEKLERGKLEIPKKLISKTTKYKDNKIKSSKKKINRFKKKQPKSEYEIYINSKTCEKCHKGNNEKELLLCEICDDAYHTFCLDKIPIISDNADWICENCIENKTNIAATNQSLLFSIVYPYFEFKKKEIFL